MRTGTLHPGIELADEDASRASERAPSRGRRIASALGVLIATLLAGRAFVWHRPG